MRAPTACRRMVSGSISLFCPKCFSPFPHGTGTLSVSREYLALPDGPGGFTQDSLRTDFPDCSTHEISCDGAVLQPPACRNTPGLGYSPVARHYWGNHSYFLFLRVLRCFSSPRSPPTTSDGTPSRYRVVPFGDPRVNGYLRLTAAFRSLSRPSSPPRA